MITRSSIYAIRALAHLAEHGRTAGPTLFGTQGIPPAYGTKVMNALVHDKMVSAVRGPGGGYEIIGRPKAISLLDIITACDGDLALRDPSVPCQADGLLDSARAALEASLNKSRLTDFAA